MESADLLSIVVPAYNEEEVLHQFMRRTSAFLATLDIPAEIIFVNDGSTDRTLEIMYELAQSDPRIAVVNLSRNFGKEIALTAGLDHARGTAVVPIDADLQDPPELIHEMIKKWREGYDVVYATRRQRMGESWFKKATAKYFYQLMKHVGDKVSIPENTGDFRLMSRKALNAFCEIREHHRFLKGLFTLVGFKQTSVLYDRDPRFAGETKWNYSKLVNLSIEGITSFTTAPLKLATLLGIFVAFSSFIYALWVIYKTIAFGDPVAGYPSLMVVVLFIGGVQLLAIGVIGEYLGRAFNETKRRPLYFVQSFSPSEVAVHHESALPPKNLHKIARSHANVH